MKTIVFAGGGTAGHVMPNIALIDRLRLDYNCVYVGSDGMEKNICHAHGVPFFTINTVKLRRDGFIKNIAVPFKLHSCVKDAKRVLADIKPDLVFSKGGFAALPVVLATRSPVISHESDYSAGLATRLCKHKSRAVLCAFEPCAQKLKKGVYIGTPIIKSLYDGKKDLAAYGLDGNKPILGIVGGSSGASSLNDIVISALPKLLEKYNVIHMTGKNKRGAEKTRGYCPVEFENRMDRLYATCDYIITRAGAGALAECIALKKPTIAVPLEHASRGDQLQNAQYYSSLGAIKTLREKDMTKDALLGALDDLRVNKARYISAMTKMDIDGTDRIVKLIRETVDG